MALTPLLDFFKGAFLFAQVGEDETAGDPDAAKNLATHRRIVWISALGGVVGLLSGIFLWIPELLREDPNSASNKGILAYVLMPMVITITGTVFGFSLCCLIASRRYFLSPMGQRVMKLTGTSSVIVARLVSLIVAALAGGMLVGPWFFPVAPK